MNKVTISLTSYPKRIGFAARTVKSLINQTIKADRIILWLSEKEFNGQEDYSIPDELSQLIGVGGFEIRWVKENLKPHKKYYYVLQEFPDDIVITVDDDVIYSSTMLESLLNSYKKHPKAVSARWTRIISKTNGEISKYINWKLNDFEYDKERFDLLAIGVGGVLYPPSCSNKKWFNKEKIIRFSNNQDDLWLKYCEIISDIPVVNVYDSPDINIMEAQETALSKNNIYENDESFESICNYLKNNNPIEWKKFENAVHDIEIVKKEIKTFYSNEFKNIMSDIKYSKVFICGAGKYARLLYNFLQQTGMQNIINAFLVSQKTQENSLFDKKIMQFNELEQEENMLFICGVSEKYKNEMKELVSNYSNSIWYEPIWSHICYVVNN